MSNIRVTYSGLIALSVGLVSVVTGIIFTLIVTRKLTPEEFGVWAIIGNMISYFLVAEPLITYWSTRQIARGEQVGRTSFLSSIFLSFGILPGYFVLVYLLYGKNTYLDSMFLAGILFPLYFVSRVLDGVNLGHKPQANSYGILLFESLKIPVGLIMVIIFNLGINGAILTTMIAFAVKISLQLYFARSKLYGKFMKNTFTKWVKLSWIPLYYRFSGVLWSLDVVVYSIITGSVIGVAYYAVSVSITQIIAQSSLISQAVYPKLLTKGGHEFVKENLNRLLFFAILSTTIAIVFAKPALFALNPAYVTVSLIVIIFAVRTLFYVITTTLYQILMGTEDMDAEKTKSSDLIKSRLFLIPTLQNIHYAVYLGTTAITIFILHSYNLKEEDLVTYWVLTSLIIQIPFAVFATILVKRHIQFTFSIINVIKYLIAASGLAGVYFFTSSHILNYQLKIFNFMPSLIIELLLCSLTYLGIMYLIDNSTRILFKSVLKEFIRNK